MAPTCTRHSIHELRQPCDLALTFVVQGARPVSFYAALFFKTWRATHPTVHPRTRAVPEVRDFTISIKRKVRIYQTQVRAPFARQSYSLISPRLTLRPSNAVTDFFGKPVASISTV
jgi:hypothetical protein